MQAKSLFIRLRSLSVIFTAMLFLTNAWAADHETVVHSFGNGSDGASPLYSSVVMDGAGNLYGTTLGGGIHAGGTVFELSPRVGGGWTETLLHSFGSGSDGALASSSLLMDGAGNLYGTTQIGGIHGAGTVFELSPRDGGGWSEKVLHSFNNNGSDGYQPETGLTMDSAGNLYGTTAFGGIHVRGTVFELSPKQGGGWTETVLHSFGNGNDGASPSYTAPVLDGAGNLYSTTMFGGIHGAGTIFELSPREGGGWTETVLHSFGHGQDGFLATSGLLIDGAGNLYGTTEGGGTFGYGTAFEFSPREGGGWTETVLHSFNLDGSDGANPSANLIMDTAGNLYGTTVDGGIHSCGGAGCGTAFELSPRQGGGWTETVLHSFGNGSDGASPFYDGLVMDTAGNLYGTTLKGGLHGKGTVFGLSPEDDGSRTGKLTEP